MPKPFESALLICPRGMRTVCKRAKGLLEMAGVNVEGPLETEAARSTLTSGRRDAAVLLGTDSDILRAIHGIGITDAKLLALSLPGHIGFFASATLDDYDTIERIVASGDYVEESYMRLRATVDGKITVNALNEVAIFPSKSATTLEYILRVDGEMMWRDVADGVLMATPMGSTAYSLSAGGPIVMLGTEAFLVIPVSSVDASRRPIVIPSSAKAEIGDLISRFRCELIADGIERVPCTKSVEITRGKSVTLLKAKEQRKNQERLSKKQRLVQELISMPPSAKFVMRVLEELGQASVVEIAQNTTLPRRTVRYALGVLSELGLVQRSRDLKDARKSFYKVNPEYSR